MNDASADIVRLLLAGPPRLRLPGAAAPLPLAERDAALLAWLALEGATPRARLAALLWPDSDGAAARNSLRQRLFKLRRQAGLDLVDAGPELLALAQGIGHDLDGADDLFGGAPAVAAGEFAHWLAAQRDARRRRRGARLAQRADAAAEAGDWAAALASAGELLSLEPHSEAAHRRVMRCHYLAGDRAAALLAFDHCERVLKDEVGVRPGADTLALLAAVEQAPARGVPAPLPTLPLRPPRMIGRARELAALHAAAASGLHALVLGEGGMGKSRLLAEFAATSPAPPLAQVGARPGDADRPYALLARLVRALRERGQAPDADLRPEFARFVAELGEPAATRFDAGRFEHAVERWLLALPAAPLLIDDLHFADGASLDLLAHLVAVPRMPPLLLGMRPAEAAGTDALLLALAELPRGERIELAPLAPAEIAELVDSLAAAPLAGAALAAPLARHTGGNPQFILETLRALLLEDPARVLRGAALPVPAGVGMLIERRLARLSPAAVRLARVAAVASGDFGAELAARVLGRDALDLADAWAELEAAQVLAGAGFAHDLVHEAVRKGVPAAVAALLHAGVARALEEGGGAAASIARHWLAANQAQRAIAPLREAAEQARAASRLQDAAALYETLAELHERHGERAERFQALFSRFDALSDIDAGADVDAVLDELDALAADDGEHAQALYARAYMACVRWDPARGEPLARRAIELAQRAGMPAVECEARLMLAQLLLKCRRHDAAAAVLAAAQPWIDAAASFEQRVQYEECLAWLAMEQGHFREALRSWQAVGEQAAQRSLIAQLSTALNYQMLCLGYTGRFDQAAEAGERQRALCQEYRLLGQSYLHVDPNLAHVYTNGMRFDAALAALERAEGVAGAHRSTLELRHAMLYLALGQPGRARPFAQRAVDGAEGDVQRLMPLQGLLRVLHAQDPAGAGRNGLLDLLAECDRLAADSAKAGPRVRNRLIEAEIGAGAQRLAAADAALALLAGSEMYGLLIAAHARRAQALLECGAPRQALPAVEAQLALAEAYQPETMSPGETGLVAARVFAALGDARAPQQLRRSVDWLHKTAADHVPAAFRESFLRRIPAHRELATLAAADGQAVARLSS
ncbi:ATP-binding protein [Piscinibacter sp.]|uniref:ATP-binding protein n=1 Tax=Piscinibacter sp. TaxID=1903157 RepID=UPI0039E3311A